MHEKKKQHKAVQTNVTVVTSQERLHAIVMTYCQSVNFVVHGPHFVDKFLLPECDVIHSFV